MHIFGFCFFCAQIGFYILVYKIRENRVRWPQRALLVIKFSDLSEIKSNMLPVINKGSGKCVEFEVLSAWPKRNKPLGKMEYFDNSEVQGEMRFLEAFPYKGVCSSVLRKSCRADLTEV